MSIRHSALSRPARAAKQFVPAQTARASKQLSKKILLDIGSVSLRRRLLLTSSPHMRAAAILGLGCSPKDLEPFQTGSGRIAQNIEWRVGVPSSADDADVILLFGGDGTIHRHLSQLVKLALPVLIVPAGSGNDFAHSLGIGGVRDALAAFCKFCSSGGQAHTIDLGIITPLDVGEVPEPARTAALGTRYFCCVAGVGLDGEVARRANRLPRWLRGHGGYVLSLPPAVFNFAPFLLKILTEDAAQPAGENWITRSHQPTMLAAFANAPFYGGGMKIAPRAKMDDGLLDVCTVGAVGRLKLFFLFPTVFAGRHLNIKEVEYFQASAARIETEQPMDVYADGEFVCRTPAEIRTARAALAVIVP